MQTAAAIEARVDYDTLLLIVLSEHFLVDFAITLIVHLLQMHVAQSSTGEAVAKCFLAFHPALVEQ